MKKSDTNKQELKSPAFIADFIEMVGWDHFNRHFTISPAVLTATLALIAKRRGMVVCHKLDLVNLQPFSPIPSIRNEE